MSVRLSELVSFLNEVAPPQYQEDYDNAGLIVGNAAMEISGVLVCLDSIESIVDEAIALNCNVIVAHHPIVFRGLKKINGSDYIQRTIIKAIKNDIAIFAIHTNLDNVLSNGVNERIAQKLELQDVTVLKSKTDPTNPNRILGSGVLGTLENEMEEETFLRFLKSRMQASVIRHTCLRDHKIKTVAICGGSGGFLLSDAMNRGADIFITADYKYHEFFDANDEIIIADIGHYESEQYTIELLQHLITQKFSNFAAHCTKVNTNPIKYF